MRLGEGNWWDAVRSGTVGGRGDGRGVGVVPRGTLCLGNGSEGGFLLREYVTTGGD